MKKVKIKMGRKEDIEGQKEAKITKKTKYMLAIILKANKSSKLKWIPLGKDCFSVDDHSYFINPKGSYIGNPNGMISAVYLEGASLPIHQGCMTRTVIPEETKTWTSPLTGKEEVKVVKEHEEIGIKYDSGLIDMLLNRHLSDAFTKVHLDMPNLVLTALLIGAVVLGVVNIGMWFM